MKLKSTKSRRRRLRVIGGEDVKVEASVGTGRLLRRPVCPRRRVVCLVVCLSSKHILYLAEFQFLRRHESRIQWKQVTASGYSCKLPALVTAFLRSVDRF